MYLVLKFYIDKNNKKVGTKQGDIQIWIYSVWPKRAIKMKIIIFGLIFSNINNKKHTDINHMKQVKRA